MVIIIALAIASLIPIAFLFLVRKLDLYETGNFSFVLLSIAWGGIAYFLAAQINPWLMAIGFTDYDTLVRLYAPIIEEVLKVLIILFLVRQASFTYFVDGAIFGFAAGIGFAIFENWEYVTGSPETALIQAIGRVLSTNLMHATGSGVIGIALGIARKEHLVRRYLITLGGFALAMGIHIAFNNLVTRVNSGLLLIYAAVAGFSGAGFISLVIKRGLKNEQKDIDKRLAQEEGITAQEASAVQQVDKMKKFLAPVTEKFGSEKAHKVEKFLRIQAKVAILRKSAASFAEIGDEKMRLSTEKQIETLHKEMNDIRRQVGTYCMLYLRGTFLQESSPLWGRLSSIIEERAKAPRTSDAPSLWGNLNTKIKNE